MRVHGSLLFYLDNELLNFILFVLGHFCFDIPSFLRALFFVDIKHLDIIRYMLNINLDFSKDDIISRDFLSIWRREKLFLLFFSLERN